MSEQNNQENIVVTVEEPEKPGFLDKCRMVRDKVMANKFGRIAVRGLKAVTGAGIIIMAFKAGKKSVKPTTVYIEKLPAETPAEEAEPVEEEQPAEEEIDKELEQL